MTVKFKYNDGGAGSFGLMEDGDGDGDCVTRAVALASGRPYRSVYRELSAKCARKNRADQGVPLSLSWLLWMRKNGFKKVGLLGDLNDPRFQKGRYVMVVRLPGAKRDGFNVGHAFAMVDGVVKDTDDYTKNSQLLAWWRYDDGKPVAA